MAKDDHVAALSPDRVRRIYDRIGRWQDTQAFYERAAVDELIAHAHFESATSLFEFGCGTGRVAAQLLAHHLPERCRYLGIDVSSTMVRLASARLRSWDQRSRVQVSDGSARLPVGESQCSHFLSTYVLDLLSEEVASEVIAEAHRILAPDGRLCLVSSTEGPNPWSEILMGTLHRLWLVSPALVGGCRPISLRAHLPADQWSIEHHSIVVRWGISSEVAVARRRVAESQLALL